MFLLKYVKRNRIMLKKCNFKEKLILLKMYNAFIIVIYYIIIIINKI